MRPRILFTTTATPSQRILGFASTDQMSFRLTRGQDLFVLYQHTHNSPLHLLAQNLDEPSIVLENPSLDDLQAELRNGYEYVGINFDALYAEQLLEMADLVRRRSPRTKILIGGYGAICTNEIFKDPRWQGKVDAVSHGEGIGFLRRHLDLPQASEIRCQIPKEGSSLPWLNPRPVGTIGIILSGLGCTQRCPFCVTSASMDGRYVELMNARQIARAMRAYWEHSPFTNSVTIYDENFLDHFDKVRELGQFLREDDRFDLRRYNFAAFGSLKALSRYDAEELLLTGVDTAWVGVESKFSALEKTHTKSAAEIFPFLHSIGVKTIGSWIIGQDHQTPDNIQEDIDYFVSLEPCMYQLSILSVFPGTPLWASYQRAGRIPAKVPWHQFHLYGNTYLPKHFTHTEMLDLLEEAHRRIYREQGPTLMKVLEVNLNGYEFCSRARHPALREQRTEFFKKRAQSYFPLLKTAIAVAPSPRARARLENVERRYRALFGEPAKGEETLADMILRKAEEEARLRESGGRPKVREEPFRRYTYAAVADRPANKPYVVEYPQPSPVHRRGGGLNKEDSNAVAS